MEQILSIIGIVAGSTGISSIIVACLSRHWAKKDKEDGRIDALVDAQKVLMIDRVRFLGSSYVEKGYVSLEDKENLQSMYDAYKALGGNGHLVTIMQEVDRLPINSSDKK